MQNQLTMTFTHGFTASRITYGWIDNELYRLPSNSKYRLTFKKLKLTTKTVSGHKYTAYNIERKRLTIDQCKGLTAKFKTPINVFN